LETTNGNDQVTVKSTHTDAVVTIDGHDGDDTFTVEYGSLGSRVIVADTGSFDDDELVVKGTEADDRIEKFAVRVIRRATPSETVDCSGVERLTINGLGGNDTIVDPGSIPTKLLGGAGDDTFEISNVGAALTADGEAGSDTYVVTFGDLSAPITITDGGAAD